MHVALTCLICVAVMKFAIKICNNYSLFYVLSCVPCRGTETLSDIQEQHENCQRSPVLWPWNSNIWCIAIRWFNRFLLSCLCEICSVLVVWSIAVCCWDSNISEHHGSDTSDVAGCLIVSYVNTDLEILRISRVFLCDFNWKFFDWLFNWVAFSVICFSAVSLFFHFWLNFCFLWYNNIMVVANKKLSQRQYVIDIKCKNTVQAK